VNQFYSSPSEGVLPVAAGLLPGALYAHRPGEITPAENAGNDDNNNCDSTYVAKQS